MKHFLLLFFCLLSILPMPGASAQLTTTPLKVVANVPPVAYVYVSGSKSRQVNQIYAFAAAPDGKLTPVAGSPFPADVSSLAVSGNHLFGAAKEHVDLQTFSIDAQGAIKPDASLSAQKYNSGDCGGLGPLFLDRTGATLYDLDFNGEACANNIYQSFRINQTAGQLDYLGSGGVDAWFNTPLSFIGNNRYAYGAVCLNDMYWEFYGFERHSDGMLTEANISADTPAAPGEDFYCPSQTATDAANHVVISLQAVDGVSLTADGDARLAVYTAGSSGNLSTKSTRDDMPATAAGIVSDLAISPSGKLLAVSGTAGLQLFHFNGNDPITRYSELLTKDEIDQVFWDNGNHLYAVSRFSGKLFVFTATPENLVEASGSPYYVAGAKAIAVLPAK